MRMKRISELLAEVAQTAPAWMIVTMFGILSHGLLPFTDYVLWDGWWCTAELARNDGTPVMRRMFSEVGRPLDIVFYWIANIFPGGPTLWSKILSVSAWITSCVCMGAVLRRLAGVEAGVANAVAILAVCVPTFDLLGELTLWMNTACVMLFWLGWLLSTYLELLHGWKAVAARLLALVLFFISFNLNSNLVLFYALGAMFIGLRSWTPNRAEAARRSLSFAARHADFIVAPIIFWLCKSYLTPTSGYYAEGYNQPSLEPARFVNGYLTMATNFLITGFMELFASPAWVGVVAATLVGGVVGNRRCYPEATAGLSAYGRPLILWGLVILAAAAFPYLAVNQQLASEGWLNRNAILCNFPLAVICVGILIAGCRIAPPVCMGHLFIGVIATAVLFAGNSNRNYLALQAFGAKQRSVQRKLMSAIKEHGPSVVQLRDYFFLPGTIAYYPPAIWTFMASGTAYPSAFVIDTRAIAPDQIVRNSLGQMETVIPQLTPNSKQIEDAIESTTMPYAMKGIARSGPQILFPILPGQLGSDSVKLGLQYLLLKAFRSSKAIEFEDRMTETRVIALPEIAE